MNAKEGIGFVILCEHIMSNPTLIAEGVRSEPIEERDTGWAFFCGADVEEDHERAGLVSVDTLLKFEPDLAVLLDTSVGTRLFKACTGKWHQR